MALEDDFHSLFLGCTRWSGYMIIQPDAEPDSSTGKIPGRACADHSPVNPARWRRHLDGAKSLDSLGLVPINPENNSVMWAAWDVDVYKDMKHEAIVERLEKRGIPAVVCRSKSGGAHVYLFFTEWVPAYMAQDTLKGLRASLGFSQKTEIYPKQRELKAADGQFGNWLNMPYFALGQIHNRVCITAEGRALTPEEFISYAYQRRMTKDQLQLLRPKKVEEILEGGPPCLNASLGQGVKEFRNSTALALAIYHRKAGYTEEEAVARGLELLPRFVGWEAEGPEEIRTTAASAYKQVKAHYQCKDESIERFCDQRACKKCKFGIKDPEEQEQADKLYITELIHYLGEPDSWSVTTSLGTVRVLNENLRNIAKMDQAYTSQCRVGFPNMKYTVWKEIVDEALPRAVENEPSKRLDPSEQVREVLEDWIFYSGTIDLLRWDATGGVYLQKEDSGWLAVFKRHELTSCLRSKGYKDIKEPAIISALDSIRGKEARFTSVSSRPRVWSVPLSAFPDSALTDEWIKSKTTPPTLTQDDQV